ncbi:MAG: hypothetical protein AAF682_03825 [Planctomycetota bacterium]
MAAPPTTPAHEPPGDARFVRGLALCLLAAAIAVNVPALAATGWARPLFQALLWGATALALRGAWPGRQRASRTTVLALGIIAAFAAASHVRFGAFHGGGRFLHQHELFNYTIGSKYFDELGYDGLYFATHRALLENDPTLDAEITLVKNLRTNRFESKQISLARADSVESLFTEERWREFRSDVRFFQGLLPRAGWQPLLADHGYNATPFWTALGSLFSRNVELVGNALYLLASIDLVLLAVTLLVARWGFGTRGALLFAIFFFASPFSTFEFTGGAFLRQVWVLGTVGFAACLRRGRYGTAGALLALAVADRIFPVLFLALPLALFERAGPARWSLRHGPMRLLAAFVAAGLALGAWATVAVGADAWLQSYETLTAHNNGFYLNQVSLRTLLLVDPVATHELVAGGWDEALWLRAREGLHAATRPPLRVVRIALLVLLWGALMRSRRPWAAFGLTFFAPFVLLYPANYYYVFLALPLLAWRSAPRLAFALVWLQGLLWLLRLALPAPEQLEVLHWLFSLALLAVFARFLFAAHEQRSGRIAVLASVAALAVSFFAFGRGATADPPGVLDLTTADVADVFAAEAGSEQMAAFGGAWSRDDQVRFEAGRPGARVTVEIEADEPGPHRLRVDFTAAPPYGIVRLAVNGGEPLAEVDLFAPTAGRRAVVAYGVELREGANELSFSVDDKHPSARGYQLGIDRITVEPSEVQTTPAAALQAAVDWILAHPADHFDGGRADVYAEIETLDRLTRCRVLAPRHDELERALSDRLGWLDRTRAFRVGPKDYDGLAAAALAARARSRPLSPYVATRDAMRAFAADYRSSAGFRPLRLCTALAQLDGDAQLGCDPRRSLLFREYSERTITAALAGPVDPAVAPSLAAAVAAVLQDARGLAPDDPLLVGDDTPWNELLDHGLRWARATGDLVFASRLLILSDLTGAWGISAVRATDWLSYHSEPDGSFGAVSPTAQNPRRPAVLAAAQAFAGTVE